MSGVVASGAASAVRRMGITPTRVAAEHLAPASWADAVKLAAPPE